MLKNLTAVSLFSGAGGMDIGVQEAGFTNLACVEMDPYCCETLSAAIDRENRDTRLIEQDIRTLDPEELLADLGLAPGDLDLLHGGPPCQAFSQIGKQKGLDDDRGLLLFQMSRFAKVFQPKAILIEQVRGLLSSRGVNGERGEILQELLSDLEILGYVPKWKVINAADYGIPQLRKRIFIIATLGANGFQFPEPTHCPVEEISPLFALKPYSTVGNAIDDLDCPSPRGINREDSHVDVTPDGDRLKIRYVPEGEYLAAQQHLPKELLGTLTKKDTTKYLRLSRSKPANTLRGGELFFHPTEDRYLTPREYMRLHGFPDTHFLKGPIRSRSGRVKFLDQHRQVGNSVPPPVARKLAEAIKDILLCRQSLSYSDTL